MGRKSAKKSTASPTKDAAATPQHPSWVVEAKVLVPIKRLHELLRFSASLWEKDTKEYTTGKPVVEKVRAESNPSPPPPDKKQQVKEGIAMLDKTLKLASKVKTPDLASALGLVAKGIMEEVSDSSLSSGSIDTEFKEVVSRKQRSKLRRDIKQRTESFSLVKKLKVANSTEAIKTDHEINKVASRSQLKTIKDLNDEEERKARLEYESSRNEPSTPAKEVKTDASVAVFTQQSPRLVLSAGSQPAEPKHADVNDTVLTKQEIKELFNNGQLPKTLTTLQGLQLFGDEKRLASYYEDITGPYDQHGLWSSKLHSTAAFRDTEKVVARYHRQVERGIRRK